MAIVINVFKIKLNLSRRNPIFKSFYNKGQTRFFVSLFFPHLTLLMLINIDETLKKCLSRKWFVSSRVSDDIKLFHFFCLFISHFRVYPLTNYYRKVCAVYEYSVISGRYSASDCMVRKLLT